MISCTRQELESARNLAQSHAASHNAYRWRVMLPGDALRYIYSDAPIPPAVRTLEFQRIIVPGEGTRWVLATPVRLILSEAELRMARQRNIDARLGDGTDAEADRLPRAHRVEYCELPVTETGTPTTTPPP